MYISNITYRSISWITVPKVPTDALWTLTWLFVALGVIYFVAVFVFKNKLNRHFIKTKSKHAQLAPIISNFLFHSTEDPKEEQKEYVNLKIEIREFLNSRRFRKIVSTILFDLQKDVAGGTKERLFKLYKELGLHHDSYAKLNSWRWQTVAKGLNELAQMQVEESFQMISKFLNDRRGLVRKQAEIAIITLRHDGINHLLDTTTYAISEWQQLKLIEALDQFDNYSPPKFSNWLISQNNDVVLLALRLIRHFNQNEAAKSITQLVKHKDDEIKLAAISCIKDFNFSGALTTLKNVFWQSSDTVKIQLLDAIALLGDSNSLPFLKLVVTEEQNFMVLTKAQSTINAIVPETILPSKDLVETKKDKKKKSSSKAQKPDLKKVGKVKSKGKNTPINDIEVTEIEVYDIVKKESPKETVIEEATFIEPEFEIGVLDEMLDQSMNASLGLVATVEGDNQEPSQTKLDNVSAYKNMSFEERTKFINTMAEVPDARESELLEYIMENEVDAELRFQAFDVLKRTKQEQTPKIDEIEGLVNQAQILPLKYHSIFFELYEHCSDLDSKKLLIREAMFIGDLKELHFLKGLLESEPNALKPAIIESISVIENRCENGISILDEAEFQNQDLSHGLSHTQKVKKKGVEQLVIENETEIDKLPLEFCFLNLEKEEETVAKVMDTDIFFDFELSKEFHANVAKSKNRIEN
ncbi:MAG: HEAT repeat domain-containing protein [Croceitalea sp.]|nr:HEAT repeat domain-containing protein [Croceitalea sp.]